MLSKDRIIVALDVSTSDEALKWVSLLSPHVGLFKIGLELMNFAGAPQMVEAIHARGGKVFFDGKFHDIPNTMAGAAKATAKLGVSLFDVHASCGVEGMKAAVKEKGKSQVLAVTVLTSMDDDTSTDIYGKPAKDKVLQFATDAVSAGCDGVVCSPQELRLLNENPKTRGLIKVTPGIRPKWAATGDQKRVFTPADAVRAGADYLVIGRPILSPPESIGNPVSAAEKIRIEIEEALK